MSTSATNKLLSAAKADLTGIKLPRNSSLVSSQWAAAITTWLWRDGVLYPGSQQLCIPPAPSAGTDLVLKSIPNHSCCLGIFSRHWETVFQLSSTVAGVWRWVARRPTLLRGLQLYTHSGLLNCLRLQSQGHRARVPAGTQRSAKTEERHMQVQGSSNIMCQSLAHSLAWCCRFHQRTCLYNCRDALLPWQPFT